MSGYVSLKGLFNIIIVKYLTFFVSSSTVLHNHNLLIKAIRDTPLREDIHHKVATSKAINKALLRPSMFNKNKRRTAVPTAAVVFALV